MAVCGQLGAGAPPPKIAETPGEAIEFEGPRPLIPRECEYISLILNQKQFCQTN